MQSSRRVRPTAPAGQHGMSARESHIIIFILLPCCASELYSCADAKYLLIAPLFTCYLYRVPHACPLYLSVLQVTSQRMQGLLLLVFAKYFHLPFLRGVQTETTRTGLGGYWVRLILFWDDHCYGKYTHGMLSLAHWYWAQKHWTYLSYLILLFGNQMCFMRINITLEKHN